MKTKIGIAAAIVILCGIIFLISHVHSQIPPVPPGSFISTEHLANVGYATPEAAFETMMWAEMKGKYDTFLESYSPKIRAELEKEPIDRKQFEHIAKSDSRSFRGTQIMAKKIVSDDKVELKVSMEGKEGHRTFFVSQTLKSDYGIQTVVKVGSEWKMAGGFGGYTTNWDESGSIITFAAK